MGALYPCRTQEVIGVADLERLKARAAEIADKETQILLDRTSGSKALYERALKSLPSGVSSNFQVGDPYPIYLEHGKGSKVWDVDGTEYVDLMCSYGPIVLGHQHSVVEAAARAQAELADCQNGPGEVMVELAELLVATVHHADWAMFAKNGTDATTTCCTIARAHTGRSKILVATGAYHGAAPWCTPRLSGVTSADRANLGHYTFNDLASVTAAAAAAGPELAGVVVSPFKHDAGYDQELVDPAFARARAKRERGRLLVRLIGWGEAREAA